MPVPVPPPLPPPRNKRRPIPATNKTNQSPAKLSAIARQDRATKCISGQWNGAFLDELEEHLVRKVHVHNSAVLQHLRLEQLQKSQFVSGKPTAVEKLAETSQMLKHAVVNLINYQDDANLASKAIPELISLMTDDDSSVQCHCLQLIWQLSRKDASRAALIQSPPLIGQLVRLVSEQDAGGELSKLASAILYQVSQHRHGLLVIYKTGGINALVKMLGSPNESVVMNAISTLHNLLLHQEGSKMAVRLSGGLQKMVSLLARNNQKMLALVTDCLQMLAYGNQEGKLIILASGGPQELVRIMSSYSYEKLLWTTSRVLKVLSVCPSNKPAIVQAGGLQALAPHLKSNSERLQLNCLHTIRNLSDESAANQETTLGPLLRHLLDCLLVCSGSSEEQERICAAAGALSNLTCNQPVHKQTLVQAGAIGTLLNLLNRFHDKDDLLEAVLCTLRHLCQRHSEADQAVAMIRQSQPLGTICKFLTSNRWAVARSSVQLVRSLALDPASHGALREHNVVQKLINLLVKTVAELRRQRPGPGPGGLGGGPGADAVLVSSASATVQVDGVPLLSLLEACVGALQLIAKEISNRDLIRSSVDVIPLLVQLLYGDVEPVQRAAVGLLCELATEKEGAEKIELQGASVPLTNLLNSRNEAIAAYSAAVLLKLSDGKSLDYKKQLSSELSNTLYRSDAGMMGQTGNHGVGSLGNPSAGSWTLPAGASAANAAAELELGNLLFHSQFATLPQSMSGGGGPVGAPGNGIYQGVYTGQPSLDQLQNPYSLDPLSLSTGNTFNPYGQIGASLGQPMSSSAVPTNMPNNGWLI